MYRENAFGKQDALRCRLSVIMRKEDLRKGYSWEPVVHKQCLMEQHSERCDRYTLESFCFAYVLGLCIKEHTAAKKIKRPFQVFI